MKIIFEFSVLIKYFLFLIFILGILELTHRTNLVQATVQCTVACTNVTFYKVPEQHGHVHCTWLDCRIKALMNRPKYSAILFFILYIEKKDKFKEEGRV